MTGAESIEVSCFDCGHVFAEYKHEEILCPRCQEERERQAVVAKFKRTKDYTFMVKPIRNALKWARNSKQVPGALVTNGGIGRRFRPFYVSIYPIGDDAVGIHITAPWHVRLTKREVGMLRRVVKSANGHRLPKGTSHWGGVGRHEIYFKVPMRAKSLNALLNQYSKGCPKHKSVFCGHKDSTEFWRNGKYVKGGYKPKRPCTWLHDGHCKARLPRGWS